MLTDNKDFLIGSCAGSGNNTLTINVTGNGSTWTASALAIGRAGGNNTVTVADGFNY